MSDKIMKFEKALIDKLKEVIPYHIDVTTLDDCVRVVVEIDKFRVMRKVYFSEIFAMSYQDSLVVLVVKDISRNIERQLKGQQA